MRKKMYKKGKFWVVATVAASAVVTGTSVAADEVVETKPTNQEVGSVQADTTLPFSFEKTEEKTDIVAPAPVAPRPTDATETANKHSEIKDTLTGPVSEAQVVSATSSEKSQEASVVTEVAPIVRSAARAGSAAPQRTTQVTVDTNGVKFQFVGKSEPNDRIKFAFWSDKNGQDDLVWYDANVAGAAYADFRKHRDYGKYNIHTYAERNGRMVGLAGEAVTISAPTAQVKLENLNLNTGTYDVIVSNITAPNGLAGVKVPTWSDKNGQDDLVWYDAQRQANGTYKFTLNIRDHKNERGSYNSHVYIVDRNNQVTGVGGVKASFEKASAKLAVTNAKPGSYDVVVSNLNAPNGVREVLVPTWSDRAGQDDLIWHKATKQANGNYTFTVKASEHKNDAGTYYTHAYVVDNNGNRQFLAGTKANMQAPIKASAKLAITNAKPGSYDVVVSNLNAPNGVREVLVPTWSDRAGQDDLIWHKATKQANGNYTFTVKASEHKNDAGTYYTHAYVVDNNGNRQFLAGTKANMQAPIKASAKLAVTNAKPGSYDVVVSNLNAPNGVREVLVPTWSERAGQDDLIWHKATKQANGNYTFTVKASEHKNDAGTYYTHAYVVDNNGNRQILATATANMQAPIKASAKLAITNAKPGSYDVVVSNLNAPNGVREVLVPTWSERAGQDDLIWHKATKQANGNYTFTVKASEHKNDAGTYYTHAYVVDNNGNRQFLAGTKANMQAPIKASAKLAVTNAKPGSYDVVVSNLNAPNGVREVLVPTWSERAGQDDLIWHKATKQANGNYTFTVKASEHKNDAGTYYTHAYVVDAEGKRQILATATATMTLPALRGNIRVINNDTYNGRFEVVISDVAAPNGVKEVKVPVWSDVNGQDDLNWYTARRASDGTYRVAVDSANHAYSQGKYNIHLYYIQNDGEMTGVGTSTAQMVRTKVENQKERILRAAAAMIGVRGGTAEHTRLVNDYNSVQPLPVGYAVKTWDDWCDIFVTVLFQREGLSHLIGRECGVERHINIFKQKGIWNEDGNATPQRGDIITFNWDENRQPNNGWADHIGIVEKVENGIIHTIEGNSNNIVKRNQYRIGHGNIRGFARPHYG